MIDAFTYVCPVEERVLLSQPRLEGMLDTRAVHLR